MSSLGLHFIFVCIGFKTELQYYLYIVQINLLRISGKVSQLLKKTTNISWRRVLDNLGTCIALWDTSKELLCSAGSLLAVHECISTKTCGTVSQFSPKCITYLWGRYSCDVNGEAELPHVGRIVLPLEDLKKVGSAEMLKYLLGEHERGVMWTWGKGETKSL